MSFQRLLKDSATGLYYDGKGGWVSNHVQAHGFQDSQAAVLAAVRLEIRTLHLVLKFPDDRMDISYPLTGVPPPGTLGDAAKILVASVVPATGLLTGLCR